MSDSLAVPAVPPVCRRLKTALFNVGFDPLPCVAGAERIWGKSKGDCGLGNWGSCFDLSGAAPVGFWSLCPSLRDNRMRDESQARGVLSLGFGGSCGLVQSSLLLPANHSYPYYYYDDHDECGRRRAKISYKFGDPGALIVLSFACKIITFATGGRIPSRYICVDACGC